MCPVSRGVPEWAVFVPKKSLPVSPSRRYFFGYLSIDSTVLIGANYEYTQSLDIGCFSLKT